MRSIVSHQAAGRCTLKRDEIQPRRGWWYAPHFARRWYAKPAAWIKKSSFRRTRIFWLGHRDSNPGNDGVRVRCLTAWRCPNIFNALYYSRYFIGCQYLFSTFLKNLFSFQKKRAFLLYNARLLWYNTHYKLKFLPVAQLDSASDSDSEGQRFKSVRVGQSKPPRAGGFLFAFLACCESAGASPRPIKLSLHFVIFMLY